MRRLCVSGTVLGAAALAVPAFAGPGELPQSSVEKYRVESHYGPEEALFNPYFKHENRFELSIAASYQPVSSLQNYFGYGGSLAYHFDRRHAFEPIYYQKTSAKLTKFVKNEVIAKVPNPADLATTGVEMPRHILAASYLYSPFYAKMSITERTVWHFDVFFGAGLALVKTQEYLLNDTLGTEHSRLGGAFTAGLRFLMPSRVAFRVELRDFLFPSRDFNANTVTHNFQIGLAASLFL